MFKNVASQKIQLFAFDITTGAPKTGDAANITAYVSKDHGSVTVLGDTSATEMDSTNAKGIYVFDLTQGETNADELTFSAKSSTANISITPRFISTTPANFTTQSIDSNGRVDVIKVAGTTQTARDIGASVLLSAGSGAGQLDFTSGVVKANVTQFGGSAGTFASGIPAVNAAQIGGDATAGTNLKTAFNDTAGAVPWIGIVDQGTAQAATGTTLQLRSAAAFADDELIGSVIEITGGSAGVGQVRAINDYVSSTDTATVDAWTTTPTGTITYKVWASPPPVALPAVNVTHFGGSAITSASGIPEVKVASIAANAITATAINADAITAAKIADGAIDRATFAADTGLLTIRSNTAQAGASTSITLDASASSVTDFYKNDLVFITGGTGLCQSRYITAYNGTTKVATVSAWATNPDNTSTFAILPGDAIPGATAPTAADVADAVWDELLSGHAISGSAGAGLSAAGSAGDPWSTALPGSYGSGTAGKIIGDNINAAISSRAAASVLGAAVGASISADIAAVKTDTAAVKVQTDKLTFTVANQIDANVIDWKGSTAPAMTGDAFARLGAPAGASVSADVAAIQAKTTNIPASPAAVGSAMALTSGERTSVADALLDRDMSTGTDSGSTTVRTVRQALRALRNKVAAVAGTLSVYKEDDSTVSFTAALTTDAAAVPITAIDPAGP